MFGCVRVSLVIAASMVLALPVAAQAPTPTTTAFDGTYAGVSREVSKVRSGGTAGNCGVNGVPGALTIANGAVRSRGGGGWEGTVSPQGVLVMRSPNASRFDGQIDSQGTVRGQVGGYICVWTYVWQKKGK
jgi:hypothetical protein